MSATMLQCESTPGNTAVKCVECEYGLNAEVLNENNNGELPSKEGPYTVDPDGFLRPAITYRKSTHLKTTFICSLCVLFFLLGILITWTIVKLNEPMPPPPTQERFTTRCHFIHLNSTILLSKMSNNLTIRLDNHSALNNLGHYYIFESDTCLDAKSKHPVNQVFDAAIENVITLARITRTPSIWKTDGENQKFPLQAGQALRIAQHTKKVLGCCVVEAFKPELLKEFIVKSKILRPNIIANSTQ